MKAGPAEVFSASKACSLALHASGAQGDLERRAGRVRCVAGGDPESVGGRFFGRPWIKMRENGGVHGVPFE
jgi:hypothetical protein